MKNKWFWLGVLGSVHCGDVDHMDLGGVNGDEEALLVQDDMGTGRDASNWYGGAAAPTGLTGVGQLNYIDRLDYYKIAVSVGQKIDVSMTPPAGANFNLYLYKPTARVAAASVNSGSLAESVSFTADVAGDWRVLVYRLAGSGMYSLTIAVSTSSPDDQNDMATGGDAPDASEEGVASGTLSGTGTVASLEDDDCFLIDLLAGQRIQARLSSAPGSDTPLTAGNVCFWNVPGRTLCGSCGGGGFSPGTTVLQQSTTAFDDGQAVLCVHPQVTPFEGRDYSYTGDYALTIEVVEVCDAVTCGAGASCDPFYEESLNMMSCGPTRGWCVCDTDPSLYTSGSGDPCSL